MRWEVERKTVVTDIEMIDAFLGGTRPTGYFPIMIPTFDDMGEAKQFTMPHLDAMGCIDDAIYGQKKICVYGDYDVDGITSSVIMSTALWSKGANYFCFIPERSDGYGLNKDALQMIADQGTNLIITVDCGISDNEEVDFANELGMDIIITDHHEPPEDLPNATHIINPRHIGHPADECLSGAGIAFKIARTLKMDSRRFCESVVDLAALGTIADMVPMENDNLTISKMGLMMMNLSRRPGIQAICSNAGISNISSRDIQFGIAPRINAAGRVGSPKVAYDLLMGVNVKENAQKLEEWNETRKGMVENAYSIVYENEVMGEHGFVGTIPSIDERGHSNKGIAGIVASKVVNATGKPAFVLVQDDNGIMRGSGRSAAGFDLYEFLSKVGYLLETYGGHKAAAGLALDVDKYLEFRDVFYGQATGYFLNNRAEETLSVDAIIDLNMVDEQFVNIVKRFEPFSTGNPKPIFVVKGVLPFDAKTMSDGKHLKFKIAKDGTHYDVIWWSKGDMKDLIALTKVDIAFTPEINSFMGKSSVQLIAEDVKEATIPNRE